VALIDSERRVVASLVHSQQAVHAPYGGVVPELAARAHLEKLPGLVEQVLGQAGVRPPDLDRIAVTRGPGLIGCLLVGVGVAAGLAHAYQRPLVGVNHLWGHVYAALLCRPELEPPLLALVVSGAHTDLVWMSAHGRFEILGRTRDDAAGEAFDKAARMLDLGYPGGPLLDRLARSGEARRQPLPRPSLPGLEFSFSGLKTALLYRLRDLGGNGVISQSTRSDLCAAFEDSVVESLLSKLQLALKARPVSEVVICGGVAANSRLRSRAAEIMPAGVNLTVPPLQLCTDNAAMIGAASFHVEASGSVLADPGLSW